MEPESDILVLGAYGLAGRAIVARLLRRTHYTVMAAGRDPDKLRLLEAGLNSDRLSSRVLDAGDSAALADACAGAAFVINAVGPYDREGAAVARRVISSGRPYLDCANEQTHYTRLKALSEEARGKGLPLITAAGAIPGYSTLLSAEMLSRHPESDSIDCFWAQFRHAYENTGLASVMGGILEAMHQPLAIRDGRPAPVIPGRSMRNADLPDPFGQRRMMEVPVIDSLVLPARFALREHHTWFYLGDLPVWLLGLVRMLKPHRCNLTYRLIERIMRHINDGDTAKAVAAGIGPEALLVVIASNRDRAWTNRILFEDGAAPTACLPVYLADQWMKGLISERGLLTPLDLVAPADFLARETDVILESHPDSP